MHSWPSTVLSPITTSPSWQRILVPSPTQTKRPNRTVPRLAIWISRRLPKNSEPVGLPPPAGDGEQTAPRVAQAPAARTSASACRCGHRTGSVGSREPDSRWALKADRRSLDWRRDGRGRRNPRATRSPSASSAATSELWRAPSAWSRTATRRATDSSPSSSRTRARRESSASPGPPGRRQEHPDRRPDGRAPRGRSRASACSRSTPRARSRRARCSATGSASPTTSSTPGCSSARWRPAARSGGLAEAALQAALLMDASGKDDVLLETVGVGQGEIDIVDHADTIVLALMPGSGDSIQALKAGVMEIPDVIVVNKSDHPLADTMVREVRSALCRSVRGRSWKVPVVRTEAIEGGGDRRAARADRRPPPAHRGDRLARRAPGSQPARRGAGHRRGAAAAPARGSSRRPTPSGQGCSTSRPAPDRPRHGGGQASGEGRDRLSLRRTAKPAGARPENHAAPGEPAAGGAGYKASADQSNGAVPLPPAVAAASATITRVRRPRAPR